MISGQKLHPDQRQADRMSQKAGPEIEERLAVVGGTTRFATAPTTLGWLLVASTVRGIFSIELGDSCQDLLVRLRERFPKGEIVDGDDEVLRRVVELVEAPGMRWDLPLDMGGTAFQAQVWAALRAIPSGSTMTYAEVARTIGRASAVRAVASACAANALAVVIPCHRVIRGDGGLGGYRWGIERKRMLLEREARGV